MARVTVLVNPARPDAAALAADTAGWLSGNGHDVHVLRLAPAERAMGRVPAGELSGADLTGADLAVSLGGDGTFLRLVPLAFAAGVPVLGVNFGRLGYLLEVEPTHLRDVLTRTLAGEVAVEERAVLAVTVDGGFTPSDGDDRSLPDGWLLADRSRDDGSPGGGVPGGGVPGETLGNDGPAAKTGGRWWVALNEMVAEKTVPGHMVGLSTAVDGEPFLAYKADGVIVATPTGSTAYNLSAGGPVLAPGLAAMVLTPVAPHLAIDRSVVLRADQTVTVEVDSGRPAVLVIDGRETGRIAPGSRVVCRVASTPLRVVCPAGRGFAAPLRTALTLGSQP